MQITLKVLLCQLSLFTYEQAHADNAIHGMQQNNLTTNLNIPVTRAEFTGPGLLPAKAGAQLAC